MEKEQGTTQAIRVFLRALSQHVQSRHGMKRSKSEAQTICSEVLRFLAFSKAEEHQGVLNCGELDRYIQSLEGTVAAATQVAKLNRIKNGVEYLEMTGTPPADAAVVTRYIKNWSSTLTKEARRINRIRQEERSENPPAFGDIDSFAECRELTSSSTAPSLMSRKASRRTSLT